MAQYAKSGGQGAIVYQVGPEGASGPAIQSAKAGEASDGSWEVQFVFRAGTPGIDQFNGLAAVCDAGGPICPTHKVAMAIDKQVLAAPEISAPSYAGDAVSLSGGFTRECGRGPCGCPELGRTAGADRPFQRVVVDLSGPGSRAGQAAQPARRRWRTYSNTIGHSDSTTMMRMA